ncbi:MAG: discoidin domain-containing protein [Luteolibacter sp.]|uniref:discoidin domain-containing protein n=1 Tax=Luteolibacter sp. TaxID=1962973 RepID=UPI003267F5D4
MRRITFGLLAAIGLFSQVATAASVQLAWDRNPESNVVSYELNYGTVSGIYPNTVDAGNNTTATITNLEQGTTYYFVVVARNRAGQISPKSAEVTSQPIGRASIAPSGTITSPEDTVTIEAGERVTFNGEANDPNGNTPLTYKWDFGSESGIPESTARNPGNRRFNEPGTYNVTFTVTNSLGTSDPTPARKTIIVRKPASEMVSRKRWKLKFVDSQEATGYAATNAFDGNPGTFWHTEFKDSALVKGPHEIQIDMGKASEVSGFKYLSRQDGYTIGDIGKYQFYVSMDGKKWGKAVASGTFDSSTAEKLVYFTPKRGRYLRLRSISEVNGYTDTNIAELEVLKSIKAKPAASSATAVSHAITTASPAIVSSTNSAAAGSNGIPTASSVSPATPPTLTTEVIDGRKYLSLTLSKPIVSDGVKRTVQVSPDLMDWFSGEKHTTVVIDNETILKVRDNTPVTPDKKRFIRLKETSR